MDLKALLIETLVHNVHWYGFELVLLSFISPIDLGTQKCKVYASVQVIDITCISHILRCVSPTKNTET